MDRLQQQQNLLNFWRAQEIFEPRQVPKVDRRGETSIYDWDMGKPLPWRTEQAPPSEKRGKKREWAYTVFLGVTRQQPIFDRLSDLFADPNDDPRERRVTRDETALGTISVDASGKFRVGSLNLGSLLWGLAYLDDVVGGLRILAEDQQKMNDVFLALELEKVRQELRLTRVGEDIESLLADTETLLAKRRSLTKAELFHLTSVLKDFLTRENTEGLTGTVIRIKQWPKDVTEPGIDDVAESEDFLNSFYLPDLDRLAGQLGEGPLPHLVDAYLTPEPDASVRVDVRATGDALGRVRPQDIPLGRWPSNPRFQLATRQQLAVNLALQERQVGRTFQGVNGPPGTGKTTLLKDVYAGLVTQRAQLLAGLARPEDALAATSLDVMFMGQPRRVRQLVPELTGFEMVVASSNNSAVENVSVEIPRLSAFFEDWQGTDYLRAPAEELLSDQGSAGKVSAWGLGAARLGRMDYRRSFYQRTWWGAKGLKFLLEDWKAGAFVPWADAVAAFRAQEAKVLALLAERQDAYTRLETVGVIDRDLAAARKVLAELDARRAEAEGKVGLAGSALEEVQGVLADAEQSLNLCRERKPGFLEVLFSFGRAGSRWREDFESRESVLTDAKAKVLDAERAFERESQALAALVAEMDAVGEQVVRLESHRDENQRLVAADLERYGAAHPLQADAGELCSPWLDEAVDRERSQLFIEALNLHRAWLMGCSHEIYFSLMCAFDLVNGGGRGTSVGVQAELWKLLFMVVPLVSSTFASLPRMFKDLPAGTFGWAFIDEAGQAKPQEALRLLELAQNALVVGDPLQLEPVVTLPAKLNLDVAQSLGVGTDWVAPFASVQSVADRVNTFGTYLGHGEQRQWVSAPLTVHRRCDNPMFSISNRIAYDGMMVKATYGSERWNLEHPAVPPSSWVDVPAQEGTSKLQMSELDVFTRTVNFLLQNGLKAHEIIAVSPFREVANALADRVKQNPLYEGLIAGTVHTAQGKEAPVVLLVLGTGPSQVGSRRWAAERPNLVNVAASRAKNRLYVIGDRKLWATNPYFSDLAELLPGRAPK